MVENSFRGQFYHFENHVLPISVHFCHFGVEIFPGCCTKGTRGKTQIAQKNVAHWGQCCTLGGYTLGTTSVFCILHTVLDIHIKAIVNILIGKLSVFESLIQAE